MTDLRPLERALLQIAAERDARNAAPGDVAMDTEAVDARLIAWNERWAGLTRWFVSDGRDRAQAELLRASALSAYATARRLRPKMAASDPVIWQHPT